MVINSKQLVYLIISLIHYINIRESFKELITPVNFCYLGHSARDRIFSVMVTAHVQS